MIGMRSLRNRLAVVFRLIVLGAIGTIYLTVTPRLEERLQNQKLDRLSEDAKRSVTGQTGLAEQFPPEIDDRRLRRQDQRRYEREVANAASRSSAEVIVLKGQTAPTSVLPVADSQPDGGLEGGDVSPVAVDALAQQRPVARTESTRLGSAALVAYPLMQGKEPEGVAVFADTLDDVEGNVGLIRRQILLSGGIALVVALLAGYLVARALSQRVGRLEHAARKVAAGDFSNPIQADSDDELGQLAAASHELRTPIFSLGGFLELLADEDLDEETRRQFLDQLRGQVDRMRKLATELLDLSRLESGAPELRPEPTDVGQLAREVAGEFTPAAQRHASD